MTPRALIITFVGLVVLAAGSWALSAAGAPPAVALAIASVKAAWIGLVFMELRDAHAVPRAIAIIALFFVLLLTIGAWSDTVLRL